jgi:CubicO group peptidase (beta-lactamase class C family)
MMRDAHTPGKPLELGLGWYRRATTPAGAVEHLGAGGGFFNAMRIDPSRGLGLVVMANTTTAYPHDDLFAALSGLDWSRA